MCNTILNTMASFVFHAKSELHDMQLQNTIKVGHSLSRIYNSVTWQQVWVFALWPGRMHIYILCFVPLRVQDGPFSEEKNHSSRLVSVRIWTPDALWSECYPCAFWTWCFHRALTLPDRVLFSPFIQYSVQYAEDCLRTRGRYGGGLLCTGWYFEWLWWCCHWQSTNAILHGCAWWPSKSRQHGRSDDKQKKLSGMVSVVYMLSNVYGS